MLIIQFKKRNISEKVEYQSIKIGKKHKKPSSCGLRAKAMKIKCGDTIDVKHRHGQSAVGCGEQWSGMGKKLCTPC